MRNKEKEPTSQKPKIILVTNNPRDKETGIPDGYPTDVDRVAKSLGVNVTFTTKEQVFEIEPEQIKQSAILIHTPYLDFDVSELTDFVRKFKHISPTSAVIVATADPDLKYARGAFMAGATDYIEESMNPNKITALFKTMFPQLR